MQKDAENNNNIPVSIVFIDETTNSICKTNPKG